MKLKDWVRGGKERPVGRNGVFFDLYGTLIDIRTDEYDPWVYSTLSQYLSYVGVDIGPEELKSRFFGWVEAMMKQSPEKHPEVDVFEVFRNIMTAFGRTRPAKYRVVTAAMLFRSLTRKQFGVFPGVHETLGRLKQKFRLALISDAQWVFSEPEMEMTGIREFFEARFLSSNLGFKKPDARVFLKAMNALKVRPENAVYIGDNPSKDLVGAKNSGMKCIIFRNQLSQFDGTKYNGLRPDACIQSYAELDPVLDDIFGRG
jgi:putative hydrolase of the HAD superfamily